METTRQEKNNSNQSAKTLLPKVSQIIDWRETEEYMMRERWEGKNQVCSASKWGEGKTYQMGLGE